MMHALRISARGFSCRWIQLVGVLLMSISEVKEFVRQSKTVQNSGNQKAHLLYLFKTYLEIRSIFQKFYLQHDTFHNSKSSCLLLS